MLGTTKERIIIMEEIKRNTKIIFKLWKASSRSSCETNLRVYLKMLLDFFVDTFSVVGFPEMSQRCF